MSVGWTTQVNTFLFEDFANNIWHGPAVGGLTGIAIGAYVSSKFIPATCRITVRDVLDCEYDLSIVKNMVVVASAVAGAVVGAIPAIVMR